MDRDKAEKLIQNVLINKSLYDAAKNDLKRKERLEIFDKSFDELVVALTTTPNFPALHKQVEAARQKRIEECAKEVRYWHRMQANMGHADSNLREILFRYIT